MFYVLYNKGSDIVKLIGELLYAFLSRDLVWIDEIYTHRQKLYS